MMRIRHLALLLALLLAPAAPGQGVMLDERPPSGDPELDAGLTAFAHNDWQSVLDHLGKVVERRPWHDEAHALMGFAWRKLGDYERSLAAYDRALELNPHNRPALEYLGEAYLELGRPEQARAMLDQLEVACRRARGAAWRGQCEEWDELKAAYDAHHADAAASQ